MLLLPERRRGHEFLDLPDVPPGLASRSLADVARSNTLFGGARAILVELDPILAAAPGAALTLLDVGTGAADIPPRAVRLARRHGVRLTTIGVDDTEELARAARDRLDLSVLGDGFSLPLADRSVDVVTCSQVLHHFDFDGVARLCAEMARVARRAVVVGDLRRSWLAAGGFWAASFPLGFHPVSRHDGVLSVLRGFTPAELRDTIHRATGVVPVVTRRLGWRVTATWRPASTPPLA